ncbi:MAG: transglycosylase domain-containing protein, partial [Fusobacteriaceae bacterium]
SATRNFFRKELSEINVAEAALLAAIPNRPEKYNPRKYLDVTLSRARLIMKFMYDEKYITREEYEKALAHKFYYVPTVKPNLAEDKTKEKDKNLTENIAMVSNDEQTIIYDREQRTESSVPDFTDIVYDFLRTKLDDTGERMFSDNDIYTGGLKIYSTLDLEYQKAAKETAAQNWVIKAKPGLELGMVTMNALTGEVVAVNGGINFSTGNFNRSTMARRQLGSASKAILYFTALLKGFETNSVIDDEKMLFEDWSPENYGDKYYGRTTLLNALDKSLNMVSIKLLQSVGLSALRETIKNFEVGFNPPQDYTAALGSYEGTPLQVAQAYAVFANGGYAVKPIFISRIEDKYGNILYTAEIKKQKIYDSIDISLMNYMMQSSVRFGTSSGSRVRGMDGGTIAQGGKTGTTNENRTVWYAGITPTYVTAIYMGYDDNVPIDGNITGGSGPAPVWRDFYQTLIGRGLYKPERFTFIDQNISSGALTEQTLDNDTGLINPFGRTFLLRSGKLVLEKNEKYSDGIAGVIGFTNEAKKIEQTLPSDNQKNSQRAADRILGD